jgi:hypothetical protein
MGRSLPNLDDAARKQVQELLTPQALAGMGVVLGLYGASFLTGVGPVATATLVAASTYGTAASAREITQELGQFVLTAARAETDADLNKASEHFAQLAGLGAVELLSAALGAKAGQVSDELVQLLARHADKLDDLSANDLKLVGNLVTTVRERLGALQGQLKGVWDEVDKTFDGLLRHLDKLFAQDQVTTPEGIRFSIAKEDILANSRSARTQGASSSTATVSPASDLRVAPDPLIKLQTQGILPETIQALEGKGFSPESLNDYLGQFDNKSTYPFQNFGPQDKQAIAQTLNQLTEKNLNQLTEKNLSLQTAQALLQDAAKQPQVLELVHTLAQGNLRNPQVLPEMVGEIQHGKMGLIWELEIAAQRIQKGHEVQLGAIKDASGREIGGDVVDYTTREVIQSKNIVSPDARNVWDELNKAATEQLSGERGEIPPVDERGRPFLKVVELRIQNKDNPLFKLDSRELNWLINHQRIPTHKELQGFDGLIRITNSQGIHEFKVRADKSQRLDRQSAAPEISQQPVASAAEISAPTADTSSQPARVSTPQTSIRGVSPPVLAQLPAQEWSPNQLLAADRWVKDWQKQKPWLPPEVRSDAATEKLIGDYSSGRQQLQQLQQAEQRSKLAYEQLHQQRNAWHNFGRVSSEQVASARQTWLETSSRREQIERHHQSVHDRLYEAKAAAKAYERWISHPDAPALQTLKQQLQEPQVAQALQEVQEVRQAFAQWETAAAALNRPPQYQQVIHQAKADYLEQGQIPSEQVLSAMQQDLDLHWQHHARQQDQMELG